MIVKIQSIVDEDNDGNHLVSHDCLLQFILKGEEGFGGLAKLQLRDSTGFLLTNSSDGISDKTNIARGTTDPGYKVYNLSYLSS